MRNTIIKLTFQEYFFYRSKQNWLILRFELAIEAYKELKAWRFQYFEFSHLSSIICAEVDMLIKLQLWVQYCTETSLHSTEVLMELANTMCSLRKSRFYIFSIKEGVNFGRFLVVYTSQIVKFCRKNTDWMLNSENHIFQLIVYFKCLHTKLQSFCFHNNSNHLF